MARPSPGLRSCVPVALAFVALFVAAPRSAGAKAAPITDCASFGRWFGAEPAAQIGLPNVPQAGPIGTLTRPDELPISFTGAASYRGNVGGGGCLAGWYDPRAHVAAVRVQYDTYADVVVFSPKLAPVGLPAKALGTVMTRRGLALGMTLAQVERIAGPGRHSLSADGATIVRYAWLGPPNPPYTREHFALALLFVHGHAVAIDLGAGF